MGNFYFLLFFDIKGCIIFFKIFLMILLVVSINILKILDI